MIVWRDAYNVGVKKVDDQHQELVKRMNDFMDACAQQKGKEKVVETLVFLKEYTLKHFSDEEDLMRDTKFAGYEAHRREHESFIGVIDDLLNRVRNHGLSILTTIQLNRILVDWLLNHIQKNDAKIGEYIRNRSATA